jgi:tetratricopeptide (TPR) repeat protein
MVAPHAPLEYPDGHQDPFNLLRPLIGYGPETMHWAYNRFYPPELAYVESRNASPDRSHNETWDSLVFTGLLGFLAYLFLFTSLFYFGLQWLGLMSNRRQQITFFSLYFGSGLPFGLILGLILYLVITALKPARDEGQQPIDPTRALIIITLLSALVSHFAEINFGIAIVSTRTYFYFYAALLVVAGLRWPIWEPGNLAPSSGQSNKQKPFSRRKRGKSRRGPERRFNLPSETIIAGLLGGMLLLPMIYEFVSNLTNLTSSAQVMWTSFTQVGQGLTSYGVLALVLTTWLASSILIGSENQLAHPDLPWWQTLGAILGISALAGLLYAWILSASLAALARVVPQNMTDVLNQTTGLEGLTTQFYTLMLGLLLLLGLWLATRENGRTSQDSLWMPFIALGGLALTLALAVTTNLRIIHADIAFKMAEPFANSSQWQAADTLYRRAIDMAPDEDFYYLMLGRASLEYAKTLSDPTEQAQAFETAVSDLERALTISPLNPDHVRNLARLHAWWAMQTEDESIRRERGLESENYFEKAISLSPNNVLIWNEWASMQYQVYHDLARALELIQTSIEIDPDYEWSQAFAGDVTSELARDTTDEAARRALYEQSAAYYQRAIEILPQANYFYALANVFNNLGDTQKVIDSLDASLAYTSEAEVWKVEENLSHYYLQLEDAQQALVHAQKALGSAPSSEIERLQSLVDQLMAAP